MIGLLKNIQEMFYFLSTLKKKPKQSSAFQVIKSHRHFQTPFCVCVEPYHDCFALLNILVTGNKKNKRILELAC